MALPSATGVPKSGTAPFLSPAGRRARRLGGQHFLDQQVQAGQVGEAGAVEHEPRHPGGDERLHLRDDLRGRAEEVEILVGAVAEAVAG